MPEGPEIKYLEFFIRDRILGATFEKIYSNTKTKRDLPSSSKVIDTGSKGKILWIRTNQYWVHLHMGLTGWLQFDEEPRIYKYLLCFRSNGDTIKLYISDRRRFSSIGIYTTEQTHKQALDKTGTCLFCPDFTLERFKEQLGNSKRNISAFLLDQKQFAGIGNYIRNDALYIAKISPKRKLNELKDNEVKRLYNAIKFVIYSNLYDWLESDDIKVPVHLKKLAPKKLSVPYRMRVYGREVDQAGRKVKYIKNYAGRKTYYVPEVQK